MAVISLYFIIFVVALLIIYYIVPKKYRWIVLLIGSLIFYFLSSKKLIVYILFSTLIVYIVGVLINKYSNKIKELDKEEKEIKKKYQTIKKIILVIGIILNILLLVYTKYINFIFGILNSILSIFTLKSFSLFTIVLPLGISYYTLETISYMVDIYRGKIEYNKNYFKILLYLSYFPKIIEGPICKFDLMEKEFTKNKKIDFNNLLLGCDLIVWGLFKKMVIADRAGIYVNNVFSNNTKGFTIIFGIVLYTLQIYTDFSGCIDVIRGVSKLFDINLPINFKRPFFSKNIQEFWRRWHISLGTWIKDYVFYPISFSKMNMKVVSFFRKHTNEFWYKFIASAFPLLFVWLVNGIWHGASFKYILYGLYYYTLMMIGLLLEPLFNKIKPKINNKLLDIWHTFRTIIIVSIGMTLFRATTLTEFGCIIQSIFKKGNGILNNGLTIIDFTILMFGFILILVTSILEEKNKLNIEEGITNKVILRSLIYTFLLCMIIIFGIYGEGYDASNFIYGAF